MSKKTIITIARQYGSGGQEIGEKIAKALDVPFYDKELISLAAKESGLSEELFQKVDERATNSLLYSLMMGSFSYGGRVATANELPINDKLFLFQADIIKKAANEGPCVIVGRCADYILREFSNVLNVFIYADKEYRIQRAIEKYGVDPSRANDVLTKKDKQRANYYNFYTNRRWDNLDNYGLSVSSSIFGPEKTAELIMEAADTLEKLAK